MSNSQALTELEASIWHDLCQATAGISQWRFPVLATTSTEGPRARTIVLRSVDASARVLIFHTDSRSPKVGQLIDDDRVSIVFYDHENMTQLVASGNATLHKDDASADEQWKVTPASSRRTYLAPFVPGTPATQPEANLPDSVIGRVPEESELEPARANFAVIKVAVGKLDWLKLDRSQNTRAQFVYGDELTMTWVAP